MTIDNQSKKSLSALTGAINSYPKPQDEEEMVSLLHLLRPEFESLVQILVDNKQNNPSSFHDVISHIKDSLNNSSSPFFEESSKSTNPLVSAMFMKCLKNNKDADQDMSMDCILILNRLDTKFLSKLPTQQDHSLDVPSSPSIDTQSIGGGIKIKRIADKLKEFHTQSASKLK